MDVVVDAQAAFVDENTWCSKWIGHVVAVYAACVRVVDLTPMGAHVLLHLQALGDEQQIE